MQIHERILASQHFSQEDLKLIFSRRRAYNQIGFAYQLAFVRIFNRFPRQIPFEVIGELVFFVSLKLGISVEWMDSYGMSQKTLSEHQDLLRRYLGLEVFHAERARDTEVFIFQEALRLEQTSALLAHTRGYLREQKILEPAEDTLLRLIQTQRKAARTSIFSKISPCVRIVVASLRKEETAMHTYSEGFKQSMIAKMIGSHALSAHALSKEVGVPQPTLSKWLRRAKKDGSLVHQHGEAMSRVQKKRSPKQKMELVLKAASLSEELLGSFLRENGLHSAELEQWKVELLGELEEPKITRAERKRLRETEKKNKKLQRELERKNAALAETAALLVLQKKVQALWGEEEENT